MKGVFIRVAQSYCKAVLATREIKSSVMPMKQSHNTTDTYTKHTHTTHTELHLNITPGDHYYKS